MKVCTAIGCMPPAPPGTLNDFSSQGCTAFAAGEVSHFFAAASSSASGHNLVNQSVGLGFRRRHVLAFEQQGQGSHDADQPRNALRASRAGAEADLHFGLADLDAFAIGAHPVMAGERNLEAAAKRGAVDGAGHRFAAGFEPAQHIA